MKVQRVNIRHAFTFSFLSCVEGRTDTGDTPTISHSPQDAPGVCGHQTDKPTCLLRII